MVRRRGLALATLTGAVMLGVSVAAHAAEAWKAADQLDLKKAVEAAPQLTVEDVCVRLGPHLAFDCLE